MLTKGKFIKAFFSGKWKTNVGQNDLISNSSGRSIDVHLDLSLVHRFDSNTGDYHTLVRKHEEINDWCLLLYEKPDRSKQLSPPYSIGSESIELRPGELILSITCEWFDTRAPLYHRILPTYYTQMLDGKSNLARLGLEVHLTSGYSDYGFRDPWVLEIKNNSERPIKLETGMKIGQVSFIALDGTYIKRPEERDSIVEKAHFSYRAYLIFQAAALGPKLDKIYVSGDNSQNQRYDFSSINPDTIDYYKGRFGNK